jgi:hypothetical protein
VGGARAGVHARGGGFVLGCVGVDLFFMAIRRRFA